MKEPANKKAAQTDDRGPSHETEKRPGKLPLVKVEAMANKSRRRTNPHDKGVVVSGEYRVS
jgi:hypothetical protein